MSKLVIENLNKSYGSFQALKDISLQISPGAYGLLGPNGAGKTTLMRILTTVLEKDSGSIRLGDLDWKDKHKVRNIIGYLPQKFYLYKNLTVEECLNYIAVLKEVQEFNDKDLNELLDLVNLTEHRDKKVKALSGGMVRRLGIAQAILGNPKILIVDEPTAGLDPEERIRFRNLLSFISTESIVIISTHLIEDIENTCSTVGVLNKGSFIYTGETKDLSTFGKDKIWEVTCGLREYSNIKTKFEIFSTIRNSDKGTVTLKIASVNKPLENAIPINPTLEDGYLCLLKNLGN